MRPRPTKINIARPDVGAAPEHPPPSDTTFSTEVVLVSALVASGVASATSGRVSATSAYWGSVQLLVGSSQVPPMKAQTASAAEGHMDTVVSHV